MVLLLWNLRNQVLRMIWLVLAYLFHTIGESFAGSIIIYYKIIPVKYASLMMGVYFAATGLGNKSSWYNW
jgi:POT family proton-dependent oligopeptide transporter